MTLQGVKRKVVSVSDFRFTGRLLGKGNFARVEEAVHNVLNVKVAVKIIDVGEIKEKYVIKNLHREARILSNLNHPCIVSLFQTMQLADNVYYLVTELISGGDLCSFIIGQRYGKLEERPARVYARQFVSALAHMHSFGIVHRDLKMENVMLTSSQSQIKIVDFGLSNVWTSENPLRTHCGSPEYAAPELFVAGRQYGPEVDLWSLGIIFYGMVVGQLPFVGGKKNQVSSQERRKILVAQINKGFGTAQRQAIAPLSPELRTMLTKLLTADPLKRISTKELLVHPWITEKGRRCVQIHPFGSLDGHVRKKLRKQLAGVFQIDENTISAEIAKNPYGRLGGMYNILIYKHVSEPYNTETIAPPLAISSKDELPPPTNSKHAIVPKSDCGLYNQCIVLLNKVSTQKIEQRANDSAQLVSKNGPRLSKCKIDHIELRPQTANKKIQDNVQRNTKPDRKTSSKFEIKEETTKVARRPHTTGTSTRNSKPPKRSNLSIVATATIKQSNQECQFQANPNALGMGDAIYSRKKASSATSQKSRTKGPLANDPIARSIAGYLIKNVPDYMLNLQMVRK